MHVTVSASMELDLAMKLETYCKDRNVTKSALINAAVEFFIKDEKRKDSQGN